MKKTHRLRMTAAIAAVVAIPLAAAACSASAPADAGSDTLTVYSFKGMPGQEANMGKINAAFEAAHPDIKLDFQPISDGAEYTQKVQTELLAGDGPDVVMVDSSKTPGLAKAGYLLDLGSRPWAADIAEAIRPFNEFEGTLYAAPMEAIGIGLFSNTAVLADSGVDAVPTDWPSFLDALKKIQAAGYTPISIPAKGGWGPVQTFFNMGATLVPEDWDQSFYEGDGSFSTYEPALDKMLELQSEGLIDWQNELGIDEFGDGPSLFKAGDTGFWLQGAWNFSDVEESGLDIKFTALPAGDSGTEPNALIFAGTSWGINAASDNMTAAETYVDFFLQPEILQLFLEAESAISPFNSGTNPENPGTAAFSDSVAAGNYRYLQTATWNTGDVEDMMGSELQGFLLGQTTKDQLFESLDAIGIRKE